MRLVLRLLALAALASPSSQAAEGMWLLAPAQAAPLAAIEQAQGVRLDAGWLAHQQAAAVNVGGASGSFVSPRGLILTNHHVVRGCIDRLSTPADDLAAKGFVARSPRDERRCPGLTVRVLLGVDEVTAEVPAEPGARKAAIARLEQACTSEPQGLRCDVVALYGGALQHRYRYAEYRDVRLAMAPEEAAASFGGDDDNFHFPRYAFDLALLRAYDGQGRPVRPAAWLRPAAGLQRDEPVFTVGHPGRTERLLSVAQLEALRDAVLPLEIETLAEEQALLRRYAARDAESDRQAMAPLAGVENRLKALRGELPALHDTAVMAGKRQLEQQLQAGGPLGALKVAARAAEAQRRLFRELHTQRPQNRSLLEVALHLVALREEAARPVGEQLDDYRGNRRIALLTRIGAQEAVYPALERERLAAFIRRAEQRLGREHPFVSTLLGGEASAEAAARTLVDGTRLGELAERQRWLQPDADWSQAGRDPLLARAIALQALRRPLMAQYEAEVTQPMRAAAPDIARERRQLLGDREAPDATGTLRLSHGRTAEAQLRGLRQPWKTVLGGLYARADAFGQQPPHRLSPRLAQLRRQLPADTALNFISDNDIIGGNSGSPIVNARGELVGLVFDGNLDSLPGRFHYDGRINRAVSVHVDAIFLALERLYPAAHLAREIRQGAR